MADAQHPELDGDLPPPRPGVRAACALLYDRNGRITHASEAFGGLFRRDPKDVIGQSLQVLLPGEVTAEPRFHPDVRQLLRRGAMSFERIGLRGDGTQFLFRATTTVVPAEREGDRRCCVTIEDVTAQRQTADALRRSTQRHRAMMQALPDYVIMLDEEGTILEVCSPGTFVSRPLPDPVGKNLYKEQTAANAERTRACADRARRSGRTERLDHAIDIDGQAYFREVRMVAVDRTRMLLIVQDVTDRKRTEQALAESERKYRGLFNNAQVGLFRSDASDGTVLEANDRLAEMFGYPSRREFLADTDVRKWAEPADRAAMLVLLRQHGAIRSYEGQFLRRDGTRFWARFSARLLAEEDCIEGVVIDVTEEKHAVDALADSEQRYRAVVEDQTELICRWRPNGTLTFVNDAYCRYFHRTRDQLIGKVFRPRVPEAVIPEIRKHIAALSPEDPVAVMEHQVFDAEGELRWHRWIDRAIFDEDGRTVEFQSVGRDVTPRTQALEALRQSERRYRLLAENASDLIFTMGMDLRFTYVSPAVEAMLGYEPEELVGQELTAVLPPEDVERTRGVIAEELEAQAREGVRPGHTRVLQLRHMHRDGSRRWGEVNARFLRDEQGRPLGIVGAVRDITDRRKAEDALRESEERYRAVVENAGEAIFCMNAEGAYTFMNATAAQRVGGTAGQFVGKTMWDVFPKALADRQFANVKRVIDDGKGTIHESLTLIAGRRRWYRTSIQPLTEPDGSVGSALVIASDITPLKEAEAVLSRANVELEAKVRQRTAELATANEKLQQELAERRRAEQALRESERRFRQIFEASGDAIYKRDLATGLLDYISPAAVTVTGFTEAELVNQQFEQVLERYHPEDRPRFGAVVAAMRDGSIHEAMLRTVQFRWLHKDGTCHWLSDSRTLVRDEQGKPVALIGALRDITDLKQAEEAVREAERRFRQIIEVSRDAIYKLDLAGRRYEYVSPAAERVVGFTPDELSTMRFETLVERFHPEDRRRFQAHLELRAKGTVEEDLAQEVEYRWRHKDGAYRWLNDRRNTICDQDGDPIAIVGAIRDVTERKEADQRLQASESLYRAIFDNAPIPIALVDSDLVVREINGAFASDPVVGSPREKIIGFCMRDAEDQGPLEGFDRALAGETVVSEGVYRTTTNGARFPYRSIMAPLRMADGKNGVLTIIENTSEQLRHREELRQMAERAVEALEDERNRISRELHDELGQNLTALKLDAASIADAAEAVDPRLAGRTRDMGKLIDRTIGMIRRMASDLRPLALDDLGLPDAIQWLAEQVTSRAGLSCSISIEPEDLQVSQAVATTAYRIVQEALTNVVKHAGARNVQILLTLGTKGLTISIEDDGRGGLLPRPLKEGLGLRGMRERTSLLGGTFDVEGTDSDGLRIEATLPVASMTYDQRDDYEPNSSC